MPKRKTRRGKDRRLQKIERRLAQLKPEKKFFDFSFTAANVTTSATVRFVNFNKLSVAPPEEREGRQVQMLDWQIQFLITSDPSYPSAVRLLLAWDNYPDGYGTPVGTDVLALENVYSPLNYSFKPRYQVIKDIHIVTSSTKPTCVETYKCNLGNRITQFATYDGDDADIVKNALMVFMISNLGANTPQVAYYSRCHYFDM
jgi:hypothetical protein